MSAETEARRRGLPPRLDFTEPERPTDRRPLDPTLGGRAFLRRGHPRLGLLFGGLQPRGRMDTLRIAARIDGIHAGVPWPEAPLWICSVRVRDGRRRVFGREMSEATVGVAVAASSAVPGLLAPVTIDGAEHVDGAVHSPTNLDLLAGLGYDRIVVSSPMSGSTDWRQPARAYHTRLLQREAAAVRQPGTELVLIEPDAGTITVMGDDAMRPGLEQRGGRVRPASGPRRRLTSTAAQPPSSSPTSRSASRSARRRRRATVGLRCATKPVPAAPTSSTVSTTRGSASS